MICVFECVNDVHVTLPTWINFLFIPNGVSEFRRSGFVRWLDEGHQNGTPHSMLEPLNRFAVRIADAAWATAKGRDPSWIERELRSIGDTMMVSCFERSVIASGYELTL